MRPRLRIGVLADGLLQPRWVYRTIEGIRSSSVAEVVLAVVDATSVGGTARTRGSRAHLYKLYTRLDDPAFSTREDSARPDPFGRLGIESLIGRHPLLVVGDGRSGWSEADVDRIREYDLDVL